MHLHHILIYKTETDSQIQRTNCWLPAKKGEGRDGQGVWDGHVHTAIFKMDSTQGPTVQHRELCSILCNNLIRKRIWGEKKRERDTHVYLQVHHFVVLLKVTQHCQSAVCVCVCVQSLSHVRHSVAPWTVARQAPLSMGIPQARILEWLAIFFSRGSFRPRN